jgi:hypothetical protein
MHSDTPAATAHVRQRASAINVKNKIMLTPMGRAAGFSLHPHSRNPLTSAKINRLTITHPTKLRVGMP